MIDNHKKDCLRCKWNLKIYLLYFLNGIKSVVKSPVKIIILLVYIVLFVVMFHYRFSVFGTVPYKVLERIYSCLLTVSILISGLLIFIIIMIVMGMPFGAKGVSDNLQRMGLVNSAGEAPVLLSRKHKTKNSRIMILEFYSHGIPISEWQDRQTKIESALNLGVDYFDEGDNKRKIIVYAVDGKCKLPKKINWSNEMLDRQSFVIVLGESLVDKVKVDLSKIPHLLIGGSTGSGKSVLLKLLLMQCIMKDAKVYIADFKGGVDFAPIWHEKCSIATTEEELCKVLSELTGELTLRKILLKSSGSPNIDEYNRCTGLRLQRIIVGCDEIAEVLDKTGRSKEQKVIVSEIESKLSVIARQGRAFGIHLILATQRPDANIIPGQIKNNIDFRVCGRADNVLSQIILDKTDANEKIPKHSQGRFLTNNDTLFQGYWFDDSQW